MRRVLTVWAVRLFVCFSLVERTSGIDAEEGERVECQVHSTDATQRHRCGPSSGVLVLVDTLFADKLGSDAVSSELVKSNASRTKLEQLCRELQKQNKLIVVRGLLM